MQFDEIPKVLTLYFSEEEIIHLINMNDTVIKCEILVNRLFANIYDKEGKPYIGHLYRVAQKQLNSIDKAAALLHDTIEDIEGMNADILRYLRISEEVIEIVLLVTKTGKLSYDQEISRIISSGNQGAISVKFADMCDNTDPKRLENLLPEEKERLSNKYELPMLRLKRVLKIIDE